MKIKTLAEILAESETGSASSVDSKRKKPTKHSYQNTSNKSGKSSKLSKDPDQDHSSTSEPTVDTSYFEESSAKIKKKTLNPKNVKSAFIQLLTSPLSQAIHLLISHLKHKPLKRCWPRSRTAYTVVMQRMT